MDKAYQTMNKQQFFTDLVTWSQKHQIREIEDIEVENENPLLDTFKHLLHSDDEEEKFVYWRDHFLHLDKQAQQKFANPVFLGYGNPKSDILIVGKEKGFDIKQVNESSKYKYDFQCLEYQLLKESILNNYYWSLKTEGKYFSVKKPYGGIQDNFHSGHTWRLYRKVVNQLTNDSSLLNSKTDFFNQCFITEFNHLPSQYSTGKATLLPARLEMFKKPFFKSFSKVLLTYRSYDSIKENQGLTEQIYDVAYIDQSKVGRQTYLKFQSSDKERTVILTNQLSGSAGWSLKELADLINLFR